MSLPNTACSIAAVGGGTEAVAFQVIEEKITANTRTVLLRADAEKIMPRQAAEALARERVEEAMGFRRRSNKAGKGG